MACFWKQLSPIPVLSLFFMAFVSCGGSSGDDTSRTKPPSPSPVPPKVRIDKSLGEVSPLNAENYVVSGKCDSSLQTKVVVTLGQPDVQITLDCQADSTFTGEIDIRNIVSNPAIITVTQSNPSNPQASGYSATSDLVNHIVPLVLDQLTPLDISNIASYRAMGSCESAFGDVRIKIEDQALNFNISESTACSPSDSDLNTFSAVLNIARSLAGPITIQLAQGPQDLDLRTANLNYTLIASAPPSLSINPLGVLNSATAKAYAVTGTCDFAIQPQQVALTLLEDNQVSRASDCQSNNTFAIGLNAITLQSLPSNLSTLTFQITHGNKNLDSPPLTNNIIHLKIDESTLAILNLAHATYVITGKCDPSLGTNNVEVEMGAGGDTVTQTTSCNDVSGTFSETLDVSGITEKPTVSITVSHDDQEARTTVQNNIVPLSINESALAAFNLNSSASYTVKGECDSSLGGSVEVSVIGANTTDSATCNSNNTFTVDLDGSSLTISTITFQATYGGKTVTSTPINNAIVPLSFNASLPDFNLLTSGDYTVDGKCDSSLTTSPPVNVSIKNVSSIATQISACQSNSFSVSFDLSSLIPASGASPDPVVFHASYGSENVDSTAVPNDIVPLSIDTSSLFPLSLTNANPYTFTGTCDPSWGETGTATIGIPNVDQPLICDDAQKTFSISLDARDITSRPDATIRVIYGGDTETAKVANNILRLRVDAPEPLTTTNEGSYPVSGTCNPDISEQVKVTLTVTGETAFSDCDGNDNTFSTNMNAVGVVSNPFSMAVTHGPQTETIQVHNETVPLKIDTDSLLPLNLANAATYNITGDCDSTITGQVSLSMSDEDEDDNTAVMDNSPCTSGKFSVELDVSAMRSNSVTISATHGLYEVSTDVTNEIVPLSFNASLLPDLNLFTSGTYTVDGKCDSSLTTNPLVSVSIKDVSSITTETSDCQNNSFSMSFDLSSLIPEPGASPDPVVFQASYGGKSVDSSEVPNDIVPLSIDESALPEFNLQSSSSYTLTGKCDSSIADQRLVTVNIQEAPSIAGISNCTSNTFSVNLVASSVSVSPLTFQAKYGEQTVTSTPINNAIVPLNFNASLPDLNLLTSGDYTIDGKCDSSLTTSLPVNVSIKNNSSITTETSDCQNKSFSVSFDLSSLIPEPGASADPVVFQASYGSKDVDSSEVPNDIVPLSIDESALPEFNLQSSSSYTLTGKCDFSIADQGLVTLDIQEAPSITGASNCTNSNTFSVNLVASFVSVSPLTFQAKYGEQTVTTSVTNEIVPLSFNASLPNFNFLTSGNYTVDGKCDSSLTTSPPVSVSIKNVSVIATQISACQNKSFSVSFELSSLTPAPGASPDPVVFQASYGSENVDSAAVPNDIVPLSIDTSSLFPLSLTNANPYTFTGKCDPSLGETGTATIGTPNVDQPLICDDAQKTFSISLDARDITSRPDATITVTYGGDTETAKVANNILRLRVDAPEPLTTTNEGTYPVSGTCNPDILEQVKVTLTVTGETAFSDCDGSNNTFSTNINAAGVVSNPFSMTVTHGSQTENIQVHNETIPLRIDTDSLLPLNLANAATYSVTGDCASTITSEVSVKMSDEDDNTAVMDNSPCTSGKFSVELDVSAMRSNSVTISATHGLYEISTDVTNEIVPLSFNASLLPDLNLFTSGAYTVEGKCDSSLIITSPLVSLSIKDVSSITTETSDCQNNSFSVSFELSSLIPEPGASPDPVVFQASYGGKSVDSSEVPNDIVPLSIDESALPEFNLQSSSSYTLTGKCDSSIADQGLVTLDIQEAPSIAGTSNCTNSNTFSVNLVASAVSVSPLTFQAKYGEQTVTSTPINNAIVPLSFNASLPKLNLFTSGAYTIDGKCDSSLTTSLPVNVSIKNDSSITTETSDCQNKSFSVSFDLSSLTPEPGASPDPVVFQASYGSENVDSTAIPNDIVPLSIDESALAPFNLNSSASYTLTGKCDFSIADQGLVTLDIQEAPSITGTSNCTNSNTFSVNLVASSVSVSPLTFQAKYGEQTVTTSVTNEIVPLSFNASLPGFNFLTSGNYTVDGQCDSSLTTSPLVSVSIKDVSSIPTETSDCQNKSFSVSFDLSSLIPASGESPDSVVFQASYGSENVDSAAVPNDIVLLSIDTSSLSPLNLSNVNSYTLTGKCDPSLEVIGTATIGTPNVDKTFTCDGILKTFSVSLDASGITSRPDVTITVIYGSDTETTTVTNNIPQLEVDNPEPLTATNQGDYPVSGTCNPNISEQVKVTLTVTGETAFSDCDGNDNRFSTNINAANEVSNPFSMTVTHDSQEIVIQVSNEAIPLIIDGFLPSINLANAAPYSVTGDCDSSITNQVSLSMSDEDNSTSVMGSASCTNERFSVELDVSAMRSELVAFSATHGIYKVSTRVANNIVPLSFNELVEKFDSSTALDYTLSGRCDYSLGEDVEISVIGVDITDSATCDSDNTFTVDLDGSSLFISMITFQATYGDKTVSSNSIENGVVQPQISAGGYHTCALTTSGNVKCWGDRGNGRLGNGSDSGKQSTPVDVHTSSTEPEPLSDILAIGAGAFHTCALTTSGNVKCWGTGEAGRLGNRKTNNQLTPVDVHTRSTESEPLSDIAAISAGGYHTCALTTTSGNVKCWGSERYGSLGNGRDRSNQSTPVNVHTSPTEPEPLSDILAINTRANHTCALTSNGNVKCWGKGGFGSLGNGETNDKSAPVDVHTSSTESEPLSDIAAISAGAFHTCALTTSDSVKCWGKGEFGRLGNGVIGNSSTPVDVHTSSTEPEPLSDILAISAGSDHTCALTRSGNVKCWGKGESGRLGNRRTDNQLAPVDVHTSSRKSEPLSDILTISAGDQHTCVLTRNGNIKCWGRNTEKQLGIENGTYHSTPKDVLLP